jgi:inosose dehydratase
MMTIGFHTDAFNSANWPFVKCLEWAQQNGLNRIECGIVDGLHFLIGLGYSPHVMMLDDPALLRRQMDQLGVQFSQIDAAYPLSGLDGASRGVSYVTKAIAWSKLVGCPCVDTTDGLHQPEGLTDKEAMAAMKRCYEQIIPVAEAHEIIVNIEPHGYFTTHPDRMEEMLAFVDSPFLRMNMDTGNTFIAGRDPVAFLKRFIKQVSHVHLKDVSKELAEALRGGATGIAMSHCALGDGVNASNIRQCIQLLRDNNFQGNLSIECEGQAGPLIAKSLAWVRGVFKDLGIKEPKTKSRAKK